MQEKTNFNLRLKAEKLANLEQINISDLSENDIKKIIHELEVHQIELEMQNDELKQIQKNLEEERLRYAELYNHAPVGYFTINQNQIVIQTNETLGLMLKQEGSDIENKSFTDFIHWDDKDIFYLFILQLQRNFNGHSCQLKLKTSDDLFFYAKLEGRKQGNKNIIITVSDISDLVAMQKKAEESDRLKSAFLANMSHEIRTPMNGILGFAELLKEPNLTGDEQQEYIKIIEKSGYRMLNIINDIVDISKIESGLIQVSKKETNINEQMLYIATFFKPEFEKKNLGFVFNKSLSPQDAIVFTDREKIYAILTNLVKNAIKYTNEGQIEIGCEKSNNQLLFFVKDTGIGIETGKQKAIFERFIQEDIDNRNAYEGAGLGLSISNAYVEMLGGKLWLESTKGEGAVFYFTIPIQGKQSGIIDSREQEDLIVPTKKIKILIVEDDEPSSLFLNILLKDIKSVILNATNGNEAVEICRTNPDIDLILMDLRIPGISGYKATQKIRVFNKSVIIIAQSAYGLSKENDKAIHAGCDVFIKKPIIKNELLTMIKKYIG